jgi:CubicO group peptidase (beta-lactamase class C family)
MSRLENYNQYILDAMRSWLCPGVALAIVKENDVLHQGVYGLRDVENQLPITEDTRFAMASVTKSFSAMSVALLVDDGKLEWDKPVREYIPEFVLDDPSITANITVRSMLSHPTGLPRHDYSAYRLDFTRAEFVKRTRYLKLMLPSARSSNTTT